MIMGPLLAAGPATPAGAASRTTPSGLIIPDLSWAAARFGLVPVRDGWLGDATRAYLTAGEYLAPYEEAHGYGFDPSAWVDMLLRLYPRAVYIEALAALNRTARFRDPVMEVKQQFLHRLAPGIRTVLSAVLAGRVDGQPRWFLARQPLLRAMHLVLTAPEPGGEPDSRLAALLASADHLTAAVLLAHLAADALRRDRPDQEAQFGGLDESLAIDLICNQIFNEPHDVGGLFSRTWALWTRHGASIKRSPARQAPSRPAQGRRRA